MDTSEQHQARLLAFVQPIARATLATFAHHATRAAAAAADAAPTSSQTLESTRPPSPPHDPLRPPNATTAYIHMHGSDSVDDDAARSLLDTVDEIMRVSEGALLTTRLLLRHMAEVVAFVHGVEVPVHPSLRHKVGKSAMQLAAVCTTLIDTQFYYCIFSLGHPSKCELVP